MAQQTFTKNSSSLFWLAGRCSFTLFTLVWRCLTSWFFSFLSKYPLNVEMTSVSVFSLYVPICRQSLPCRFTFSEKTQLRFFIAHIFWFTGLPLWSYEQHQTTGQHTAFYWLGFTVLLPLHIMISSLCDRVSSLMSWLCCYRVFLRPPPHPLHPLQHSH